MSLPAPYPAETRAKGWRFEVDTEKVKASDTWLRAKTGAMRGALLLLWSEAWQQTPCGTLPNDDELVSLLIDMPAPAFAKNRSVLMRGWWLADDGRLYHDTITDRVLAMLAKRASDAERAANRRAKTAGVTAASRVTSAGSPREFDTKHQAPEPEPEPKEKKTPRKRGAAAQLVSVDAMVAEGVDPQNAADWLVARKAKTLPLTPTAWADTKVEAEKAGLSIADAIKTAAGNGWGGFKAKWMTEPGVSSPGRSAAPVNRQEAIENRNRAVGQQWLREQEELDASR